MRNKLHVVIHVPNIRTALSNTLKCVWENRRYTDSFLLIPDYAKEGSGVQRATLDQMIAIYKAVKKEFSDMKLGINFLSKNFVTEELLTEHDFDYLQSDESISKRLASNFLETEFFTALAFKYSRHEKARGDELRKLCGEYTQGFLNLIPTTSGSATGQEADLSKIEEIRSSLPNGRLAIASGVTLQNVYSYLDLGVTDFIVASSLIESVTGDGFDVISPDRTRELFEMISAF